ncbi:MAG: hypothetical protein CME71_04105 [Halobacteriovorax sp.]|nr:hypothetical protein [Halobacteriovorax sp.]
MKKLMFGLVLAILALFNFAQAKMIEKPELNFSINYNDLAKGEIHYSFSLMNASDLPLEIANLDTVGITQIGGSKILYNKVAYIIKKPVQFFNYQQITNLNEIKRLMPHAKVSKISERSFKVSTKGLFGFSYIMDMEYDSEIVSTANDAAVIEAIDRARRLDGTLGQADSTIYRHIHDFSKYSNAGISLTRHYDLNGEATLVVTTNISSVKAMFAIESIIKPSFTKETETMVDLTRK